MSVGNIYKIPCKTDNHVEYWYDRHVKSWFAGLFDKEGYQLSDCCEHAYKKNQIKQIAIDIVKKENE